MRRGLVFVGFAFPIVLYAGSSWLEWPRSSMSYYYYTGARDFFVGPLVAIGLFLYLYKSIYFIDNSLLNVAGIAAVAIALFPMNQNGDCGGPSGSFPSKVHYISAIIFFSAISLVFCFYYPAKHKGSQWCAGVMGICIAAASPYKTLLPTELQATLCSYSIIFWIELGAVWAFAYYWHLKSLDMDDSLKQWLANIPSALTEIGNRLRADAPGKPGGKE
jgi:hypothetical protein